LLLLLLLLLLAGRPTAHSYPVLVNERRVYTSLAANVV